jgi:hypothetical protein
LTRGRRPPDNHPPDQGNTTTQPHRHPASPNQPPTAGPAPGAFNIQYITFSTYYLHGVYSPVPGPRAHKAAPRAAPPKTGARHRPGQHPRPGQRPGQRKRQRGTYRQRARNAPARRRPPIVRASRAPSSETALTGPVRQPQAAAATQTAPAPGHRRQARSAPDTPATTLAPPAHPCPEPGGKPQVRCGTRHDKQPLNR